MDWCRTAKCGDTRGRAQAGVASASGDPSQPVVRRTEIPSPRDQRFVIEWDVLKVAMVKDRGVADALGGKVYDLVLRFEPASD